MQLKRDTRPTDAGYDLINILATHATIGLHRDMILEGDRSVESPLVSLAFRALRYMVSSRRQFSIHFVEPAKPFPSFTSCVHAFLS